MGDLKLPPHWGGSFLSYHICVWAGLRPARRFSVAAPICESPLALPLRELSAKLTERVGMVVVDPLRLSLRSDTSPKGGGKGAVHTGGFAQVQGFPSGQVSHSPRLPLGGKLSAKPTDEGKGSYF